MHKNPIIAVIAFMIVPCITGCLTPGAPHHFGFRSSLDPRDSIDLISTAHTIEYRLLPKRTDADSVFVRSPINGQFKKMEIDKYFGNYYQLSKQRMHDVNKIEKTDSIVLKVYRKGGVQDQIYKRLR